MDVVKHKEVDGVVKFKIELERFDAKETDHVKLNVDNVLSNSQSEKIEFDLSSIKFMDSSALGALVSILRSAGE